MKLALPSLTCLLLALAAGQLRANGAGIIESPVLIYDCDICGDFKYSQVRTSVDGIDGEELCLYGYGLAKKFKLKSLLVNDDGCNVNILYGECVDHEGKRHKVYWFSSGQGEPFDPNFCSLNKDCPNQVDSVCDGITFSKSKGSPTRQVSEDYSYGTKFWRSIFGCSDSSACDEWSDQLNVELFDLGGAITKCPISATMPPTKEPFKYLNFSYGVPETPEKRMDYICAPKTLCGPFFSYCYNQSGQTYAWPSLDGIRVRPELSIWCAPTDAVGARGDTLVGGYDIAFINACMNCRLNTELTSCANLLDPVCDDGNAGHGFLELPPASPGRSPSCECELYPESDRYGVLIAALYLESKGYQFNCDGVVCMIHQAFCLPSPPIKFPN